MRNPPPLLHQLNDELARLRAACLSEEWNAAAALLRTHDQHVREAVTTASPDDLRAVLAAQRELLSEMAAWKESAAQSLEATRHAVTALQAYREGA